MGLLDTFVNAAKRQLQELGTGNYGPYAGTPGYNPNARPVGFFGDKPPVPMIPGQQMPAIPPGQSAGPMGPLQWLPRGMGGDYQLPWNDPNVPSSMKPWSLDDQFLKPVPRAPSGYVVVRDPSGRPYALLKSVARSFGMWKPSPKPPISVGDWNALKKAHRTAKKLARVEKMAAKFTGRKRTTRSKGSCSVTARASAKRK